MTKNENYNLFSELKNKNIYTEKIIQLLANATKTENHIEQINLHGKNLLIFSCIYDNENLFNFLSNKFNNEFKLDFKKCIELIYVNKNPNILKTAFTYLPEMNSIDKLDFIKLFSHNSYRQENMEITQQWMQENLNKEEVSLFIESLFYNNNRPYLIHISTINFWKEFLLQYEPKNEEQKIFSNRLNNSAKNNTRLIKDSYQVDKSELETTQNILPEISFKSKNDTLILKKRKKLPTSQ